MGLECRGYRAEREQENQARSSHQHCIYINPRIAHRYPPECSGRRPCLLIILSTKACRFLSSVNRWGMDEFCFNQRELAEISG
jgi:hypothetical protein